MVEYFPTRLENIRVIEGSELNPVVTDDFILVPSPRKYDAEREYKVVFTAQPAA